MGVFTQEIEIAGAIHGPYRRVNADVDTGAMFTQVAASLLHQMAVTSLRTAQFQLADGRVVDSLLGEIFVRIGSQTVRTICVFGEENTPTILGAYTLEGLLLAVDPVNQRLVPVVGTRLTRLAQRPPSTVRRQSCDP